jgi:HD-GYP domain-containing protein (c-di-GMP phosphodiesterase class II)
MDARSLKSDPVISPTSLIESLFEVLRSKDLETFSHSSRVGRLTSEWIQHLHARSRWLEIDAEALSIAARFHDIGKIGIKASVLNKPGALDEVERAIVRQHSEIGFELFCNVSGLSQGALGILHHHERWDGGGYPSGLRGREIPIEARFIAIVDAFDAMTSGRSYQKLKSEAEALQEIRLNAGKQFCPDLVEEFTQFLDARRA